VAIVPTDRSGKTKEMTGTQHVGTFRHKFLHYITINMVLACSFLAIFFLADFLFFATLLFGSNIYKQQVTTFSTLAGVGITVHSSYQLCLSPMQCRRSESRWQLQSDSE
jgi:hypothetical protein